MFCQLPAVELVKVKIWFARLKALEMRMWKLVLDLSLAQILPEKINKMLSLNNLGFIDLLSTVHEWSAVNFFSTHGCYDPDSLLWLHMYFVLESSKNHYRPSKRNFAFLFMQIQSWNIEWGFSLEIRSLILMSFFRCFLVYEWFKNSLSTYIWGLPALNLHGYIKWE